jgi:hypothetical protein
LDLPDIINAAPTRHPQELRPNSLVRVWGRFYIVRSPKKPHRSADQPRLIDVPKIKRPSLPANPSAPVWGQSWKMRPGPKSVRPTWCPEKAWATAKKREQRGATITDPMLVEIMAMQARKAEEAKRTRRAGMRARAA